MDIIKLLGIGLVTVFAGLTIKNYRPEFAPLLTLAAGVLFFSYICTSATNIFDYIRGICSTVGIDILYVEILFKIAGIAYISEFVSEVCRDAGENAVAFKVDVAGKLTVLLCALPVFEELISALRM